jgi:hypothetical protein
VSAAINLRLRKMVGSCRMGAQPMTCRAMLNFVQWPSDQQVFPFMFDDGNKFWKYCMKKTRRWTKFGGLVIDALLSFL